MTTDPKTEKSTEEPGFKVIDRRREGRERSEQEENKPGEGHVSTQEEAASESAAETTKEKEAKAREEPTDYAGFTGEDAFAQFILSLSTSAYMHLGLVPGPDGKKLEKNLPLAKQTIDILGLLEQKTQGNLSEQEAMLFQQLLSELRLRYVEEKKREDKS